jgi:rhomboid protease GluP
MSETAPDDNPPGPVLLRSTRNGELLDSWALVLVALGIEHEVQDRSGDFLVLVAPGDHRRAQAALQAHDRERQTEPPRIPPAPDQGWSAAGIGTALTLAAFYFVTSGRDTSPRGPWFREGAADASRIVAGELERVITALTLHADPMHLAGNALAGILLVGALGRWLGGGIACGLTLLAGALGNLIVAFSYGDRHVSVGASTAIFGALGVLGGLQFVRWLAGRAAPGGRRRALSVIAACLGVFAMLGVGAKDGKVDVLAHLAGLAAGLVIGLSAGRLLRLPVRPAIGLAVGVASVSAIAGAWALAL